jgi:hypothetical protein
MYKVRKVRNQPHFGVYMNGKLHSKHPTKKCAKKMIKMMGGALGDEPEPRYIEPIIESPRRIPRHAVTTVDDAEEIPIEPITSDVDEPEDISKIPEDLDYPTFRDVIDTGRRMIKHFGEKAHKIPLDIDDIQTTYTPAGQNLSEYIPTTRKDIQKHRDRLSEHLAKYMEYISAYSPREQRKKLEFAETFGKYSLLELQVLEKELKKSGILDKAQTVKKAGNESHVDELEYLPYNYTGGNYYTDDLDYKLQSGMLNLGYEILEEPDFIEYLMRREQKQNYNRYDPSRPYIEQRHEMMRVEDPEDPGYYNLVPVNPYLHYNGDIYNYLSLKGLQKLYYDFIRDRTIAFNIMYPESTTPYHTTLSKRVRDRNKQMFNKLHEHLNQDVVDEVTSKNENIIKKAKFKRQFSLKNKAGRKEMLDLEERKRSPQGKQRQKEKQKERAREKRLDEMIANKEAFEESKEDFTTGENRFYVPPRRLKEFGKSQLEAEESKESEPSGDTLQRFIPRRIYDKDISKPKPKPKPKPRPRPKPETRGTPI